MPRRIRDFPTESMSEVFNMSINRRRLLTRSAMLGLGTPLVATLLAACGGDDDDDDDASTDPTEPAAADEPTEPDSEDEPTAADDDDEPTAADDEPTAADDDEPDDEPDTAPQDDAGELVVGWAEDFITMDPAQMRTTLDTELGYKIYSCLVLVQTGSTTEMIPDLAERWEVSPDGIEYTFNLQTEAMWHRDYGPVTADSVVFSLLRHKDDEVASNLRAEAENISDAVAVDEHTVVVTMVQPFPSFLLEFAAYRPGFIINETAFNELGDRYNETPVGSGPFVLDNWAPGERTELVRNENYYGNAGPFSKVTYVLISEEPTREIALERGELDISYFFTPDVQVRILDHDEIVSASITGPRTYYLQLNIEHPPLDDVRVRQALWWAIDKEALVNQALLGQAEPTDTMLNPHVFGRLDEFAYGYDPDKARELLAEAGVPDGFNATFLGTSGVLDSDIGVTLQSMWSEIGVEIEIIQREWAQHVEVRRSGNFDIAIQPQLRLGPDQYVTPLMHTSAIPYPNSSRYSNPDLDALIEEARVTNDDGEREELYHEIQRIAHQEVPVIPLLHPVFVLGHRPDIQGAVPGLVILNITEMSRG